jgi:DivIVA domain-containing protein
MPLTADEIRNRRFSAGLRGYEKEEVDSFLEGVAADYQLALDAIASSRDPYGTLGQEVGDVLRYAKDSADRLSRSAQEEAARILKQATDEASTIREEVEQRAAATIESAREETVRLKAESEVRAREAQDEVQTLRRRARQEVAEIRRRAEEEAAATLESAGEKAVALVREAEHHSRELRESADAKYHEKLDEATRRHARIRAQERELNDRVIEVAKTLQRLLGQLEPGDSAVNERLARITEASDGEQVIDVREVDESDRNQKA